MQGHNDGEGDEGDDVGPIVHDDPTAVQYEERDPEFLRKMDEPQVAFITGCVATQIDKDEDGTDDGHELDDCTKKCKKGIECSHKHTTETRTNTPVDPYNG